MDIKNIIIFLLVFLLILWLQHNDDIKFKNKNRISLYDKIKIPLISSILIILIKDNNYKECIDNMKSIISSKENLSLDSPVNNKVFNDIFIGPPDF
jgi:hypothetical protein